MDNVDLLILVQGLARIQLQAHHAVGLPVQAVLILDGNIITEQLGGSSVLISHHLIDGRLRLRLGLLNGQGAVLGHAKSVHRGVAHRGRSLAQFLGNHRAYRCLGGIGRSAQALPLIRGVDRKAAIIIINDVGALAKINVVRCQAVAVVDRLGRTDGGCHHAHYHQQTQQHRNNSFHHIPYLLIQLCPPFREDYTYFSLIIHSTI